MKKNNKLNTTISDNFKISSPKLLEEFNVIKAYQHINDFNIRFDFYYDPNNEITAIHVITYILDDVYNITKFKQLFGNDLSILDEDILTIK